MVAIKRKVEQENSLEIGINTQKSTLIATFRLIILYTNITPQNSILFLCLPFPRNTEHSFGAGISAGVRQDEKRKG